MVICDIFGRDIGVVLHAGVASELCAPLVGEAREFTMRPAAQRLVHWLAGGVDDEKAVHERVVDWALQAVTLLERRLLRGRGETPTASALGEGGGPRFRFGSRNFDGLAINLGALRVSIAWRDGQGQRRDIRGLDPQPLPGDSRIDGGAFPVLFHRVHGDPFVAVVTERPRREPYAFRPQLVAGPN